MRKKKETNSDDRLPHDQYVLLDRIERLRLHVNEMYPLIDEDKPYFKDLTLVLQSILRANNEDETEHKLRFVFPPSEYPGKVLRQMQDDAAEVFDCFYDMDSATLRIIQLRRYEAQYERAVRNNNDGTAIKALAAIDKLYALNTGSQAALTRIPDLPKRARTSDPLALRKMTNEEEE